MESVSVLEPSDFTGVQNFGWFSTSNILVLEPSYFTGVQNEGDVIKLTNTHGQARSKKEIQAKIDELKHKQK